MLGVTCVSTQPQQLFVMSKANQDKMFFICQQLCPYVRVHTCVCKIRIYTLVEYIKLSFETFRTKTLFISVRKNIDLTAMMK